MAVRRGAPMKLVILIAVLFSVTNADIAMPFTGAASGTAKTDIGSNDVLFKAASPEELTKIAGIPGDTVVLKINGNPITKKQYDFAIRSTLSTVTGHAGNAVLMNEKIRQKATLLLIERELMYQAAAQKPLGDIDKLAKNAIEEQKKSGVDGVFTFENWLSQNQMDETEYLDQVRRDIAISKYIDDYIKPKVTIEDKEIELFYRENQDLFASREQIRLRQIYLPVASQEDDLRVRSDIEAVLARLRSGEKFQDLATELSKDAKSSQKGGDLGWLETAEIQPEFLAACSSLNPGDVASPVRGPQGYHLLMLTARGGRGALGLEEVKGEIRRQLTLKRVDGIVAEELEMMKKTLKLEILVPHL